MLIYHVRCRCNENSTRLKVVQVWARWAGSLALNAGMFSMGRRRSGKAAWIKAGALASLVVVACMGTTAAIDTRFSLVEAVAGSLQGRFQPAMLDDGRPIAGLLVLGGNFERIRAAAELANRHRDAHVVLSGVGPAGIDLARRLIRHRARIVVDHRPRTTFENAYYSRDVMAEVGRRRSGQWIVVTSALHMPRAMGAFRAVGLRVAPWPVFDSYGRSARAWHHVRHEILGLIYYRVRGRSSAFFPG